MAVPHRSPSLSSPDFAALAWPLPLALGFAALIARLRPAAAWPIGERTTLAAPVLALLAWPALSPAARAMAFLVAGLGAITLRFSRRYLHGERDTGRYVHWFLLALAGAALVVVSQDLIVLALAWTVTSLGLHQLLTFGPARAAAEVAAHKKFLLSRVADLLVAAAVISIGLAYGSTDLARILASAAAGDIPTAAAAGATLLAAAIVLRSAQLPFHGWLVQVMEAPTPVSALLHAGVVNLGAFVAIRLAALMLAVPAAAGLLVAVGTVTALLASLTMLTRGSVKGALAWSTCAQMGFVLVEVGLGAVDLALLHIVAHGAYKAHAFLASGSGIALATRQRTIATPGLARWATAALVAPLLVAAVAETSWGGLFARPANVVSATLLSLALLPAIAYLPLDAGRRALLRGLGVVLMLPLLYTMWHAALARLVPTTGALPVPAWAAVASLLGFVVAAAVGIAVTERPTGRIAQALYPHALAGFHLDAVFTRLTFRLWPPAITLPAVRQRRERSPLRIERAA